MRYKCTFLDLESCTYDSLDDARMADWYPIGARSGERLLKQGGGTEGGELGKIKLEILNGGKENANTIH